MLTPKQLAETLGCSPEFVYSKVRSAAWPHHKLGPRTVRFSESDVREIQDLTKRTPASQSLREEIAALEPHIKAMRIAGVTDSSLKRKESNLLGLRMKLILEQQAPTADDLGGTPD